LKTAVTAAGVLAVRVMVPENPPSPFRVIVAFAFWVAGKETVVGLTLTVKS
jgi:hypothetical protein